MGVFSIDNFRLLAIMWAEVPTREQIILGMPGSRKTKTRAPDSVLRESVYLLPGH